MRTGVVAVHPKTTWALALACALASPFGSADAQSQDPPAPQEATPTVANSPAGVPSDEQLIAAGARIGQVRIHRKNIFDTQLTDENRAVFRLANWLHIQTREPTVQARLLFKPGDAYDPRLLQESERILRASQFLSNAYIFPVAHEEGRVDIEVTTQDVWTFQPGLSFSRKGGNNNKGFGIEETNLFGTGAELGISHDSDQDRNSRMVMFRDRQLAGSWWSLTTQYADNSDGSAKDLELERPFYALDTRWAAGLVVKHDRRIDSLYQGGNIVGQYNTRDREETVHGGWSNGLRDGWTTRWLGGLTSSKHNAGLSATTVQPGQTPQNRELVYPWVGVNWVEDDYRQIINQDQIGKTEDVPFGWNTLAKFGYALPGLGSDRNAGIFDIKVSKGFQAAPKHTLLLTAAAKGRIENWQATGAVFSGTLRYYRRQSPQHTFYMGAQFDRGLHLDGDQQLLLGGDNGLRGYPSRYQAGTRRWLVTLEQRTFTDWYLFRLFRVGAAAFYDVGRASGSATVPGVQTARGTLHDLGVGLRLGNSRTGFGNVIHIDAAFPLSGDGSLKKAQIMVETKKSF